jgi:dTDP-4-amino-4,6-dideoxygalactose transaminase
VPVRPPHVEPWAEPVWHLYAVEVAARDEVRAVLAAYGIATGVHYPVPIHRQPAYAHLGHRSGAFPAAERSAERVLSLPMFPELRDDQIDRVVHALRAATERSRPWNER